MARRNILETPRLAELRRQRRTALMGKITIITIGILFLFGAVIFLSRVGFMNIGEIKVEGNKIADAELISQTAKEAMSGKYLWLFPKTNTLIYPEKKVKEALEKNFKRLTDINLDLTGTKLKITVAERVSVYTWCGLMPRANTKDKCYFTDKDGFIFEEAPYFSEEVYFKFYGGAFISDEDAMGKSFAPGDFPKFILLKKDLENIGLKPVAIYKVDDEDAEVLLSSKNERPDNAIINFKLSSNPDKISEDLGTALAAEPLKTEFKKKYASLQYIDLRVGSKIYYKFK
jgi:hypothetical protein